MHQRECIVGPITQAARGVDRKSVRIAESTHVRRDDSVALWRSGHQVLVKTTCREVSVDHYDGHSVGRSGLQVPYLQSISANGLGADARYKVHASLLLAGMVAQLTPRPAEPARTSPTVVDGQGSIVAYTPKTY